MYASCINPDKIDTFNIKGIVILSFKSSLTCDKS